MHVLDEMLETERVYVSALTTLVERFLPELQGLLDKEMVAAVGALLGVHRELLERLQDALGQQQRLESAAKEDDDAAPPEYDRLIVEMRLWTAASAFGMLCPFLRSYSLYCRGYTRAISQLPELYGAVPALGELQRTCSERLDSLLIRPVQRLLKYPLFFNEILRCMPDSTNDELRAEIENVNAALARVNSEVNEQSARAGEGQRLLDLHVALGGVLPALLSPTRALLLQMDLRISSLRRSSAVARRYAGAAAVAALIGASRGKRYRLVLLDDAVVLARILSRKGRSARRASVALPSVRATPAANRPSGDGATSLKLKAVLPLKTVAIQHATDTSSSGSRRLSVLSLTRGRGRIRAPEDTSSNAVGSASPRDPAFLMLQSTEPDVQYGCRCTDAMEAATLIEAFSSAKRRFETTRRSSERRASLASLAGGGQLPLEAESDLLHGGTQTDADGEGEQHPAALLAAVETRVELQSEQPGGNSFTMLEAQVCSSDEGESESDSESDAESENESETSG